MIKCVRVLCVKFGHACVHGIWLCACVCSISQPFSWPPYAELGAQAGSICRVNAQPQPRAAVPYKPHYSSRNHAKNHNRHTHTQRTHKDIRSERQTQLMEPRTITQWQSRQSLPGKVFLKLILAVWAGVRWTLLTRIHYSQRSSLQLDKLPISEVKWSGEELHFLGFISLE